MSLQDSSRTEVRAASHSDSDGLGYAPPPAAGWSSLPDNKRAKGIDSKKKEFV